MSLQAQVLWVIKDSLFQKEVRERKEWTKCSFFPDERVRTSETYLNDTIFFYLHKWNLMASDTHAISKTPIFIQV